MNRKNFEKPNGDRFLPFLSPNGLNPLCSLEHSFETPPNSGSPLTAPGGQKFIFPPVTQDTMQMISMASLSALHQQNCALLSALSIRDQQLNSPSNYLDTFAYQQQLANRSYFLKQRLQQQQQQIQLHQQQLEQQMAANAVTQQSSALASSAGNRKLNEISASLQAFAIMATQSEPIDHNTSIDQIMEDFDSNGITCEYDGCVSQNETAWKVPNNFSIQNIWGASNAASVSYPYNNLEQGQLFNQTLNEMCQNIWRMVPLQTQSQMAPKTANIVSVSPEYNPIKKQLKRTNYAKTDKYISVKHCVFCENNNEPEAVVKSHAVRDTLGRVLCPKLRIYICPICKASGDKAHTVKYCPKKPIVTMEQALRMESFRLTKVPLKNHVKSNCEVFERF